MAANPGPEPSRCAAVIAFHVCDKDYKRSLENRKTGSVPLTTTLSGFMLLILLEEFFMEKSWAAKKNSLPGIFLIPIDKGMIRATLRE